MTTMLVQAKKCAEQQENLVLSTMILYVMMVQLFHTSSHYLQRVT